LNVFGLCHPKFPAKSQWSWKASKGVVKK
jgi:hypothetical protein